jgi:Uncharacterized conserved protein
VALSLLATACGDSEPNAVASPTPSSSPSFRAATALIDTDGGSVLLEVEVARSRDEQERGLMGRESLPDDHGMAFVFSEPITNGFWMKNTKIALSIAFIGTDGRIQEIQNMDPCLTETCPIYAPAEPYDVALEVNQGKFEDAGIKVGDKVILSF